MGILKFLGATNRFGARSNTYSVVKDAETTKEFEIKIPVENFKVLPNSHYEVQVKYNSKRDSYRILMINKSLDGLKINVKQKHNPKGFSSESPFFIGVKNEYFIY